MIQQFLVRLLLAPVSILYGMGVSLRNFLYRKELLKGVDFDLPTISVGNLSVGGAGKTPHIEYLIRLLKDYIQVSTLSRGYKRKTKGFLAVEPTHNAEIVGDEPLQYKRKFPDIMVAVAESRIFAVPEMIAHRPNVQTILLDDAYQHRSIRPFINILLTEFSHPFTEDYLLPSGRLREWRSAYARADIIIVSKCPNEISEADRQHFIDTIKPFPKQKLFFSYYNYDNPYYILDPRYRAPLQEDWDVVLICAIARADYLVNHLTSKVNSVKVLEYEDHRYFTKRDVGQLKATYDNLDSNKKLIITTEKDAMRLELHRPYLVEHRLPVFVIPVLVDFHFDEGEQFDDLIKNRLLEFRA